MASRVLSKTAKITGITSTMKMSEIMVRLMSANAGPANVGFIGCGNMGAHMVRNLAKKVSEGFYLSRNCKQQQKNVLNF